MGPLRVSSNVKLRKKRVLVLWFFSINYLRKKPERVVWLFSINLTFAKKKARALFSLLKRQRFGHTQRATTTRALHTSAGKKQKNQTSQSDQTHRAHILHNAIHTLVYYIIIQHAKVREPTAESAHTAASAYQLIVRSVPGCRRETTRCSGAPGRSARGARRRGTCAMHGASEVLGAPG